MIRRLLFGRTPVGPDTTVWWRQADALASSEDTIDLTPLRASLVTGADDERERQEEMLDGLDALASLRAAAHLPVVTTQHRVVGTDTCHAILPVTATGEAPGPATLFLTSARVILMRGHTRAWAWHRVRLVRTGRDLAIVVTGTDHADVVHCNSYGDALSAVHLAEHFRNTRAITT